MSKSAKVVLGPTTIHFALTGTTHTGLARVLPAAAGIFEKKY